MPNMHAYYDLLGFQLISQDLKNQEATVTGFVYPKKVVKAAKATGKKS